MEAEYYSWQAYGVGLASIDSSLVGGAKGLTRTARIFAATSARLLHADRRDYSSVAVPAGTGSNLTTSSSGGAAGVFTDDAAALAIATEIAENEIAHVRYLRAALGSAAVRLCC